MRGHASQDADLAVTAKGESQSDPSPRSRLNAARQSAARVSAEIIADAFARHQGEVSRDLEVSAATVSKWADGTLAITFRDVLACPTAVIEALAGALRTVAAMRRATVRSPRSLVLCVLRLGAHTGRLQAVTEAAVADAVVVPEERRELLAEVARMRSDLDAVEQALRATTVTP